MGESPGTSPEGSGQNPREQGLGASNHTARRENPDLKRFWMMEAVVERENMLLALARVERNQGSAGIDDMPVEALRPYLREQWPSIKEELLNGQYWPKPVRRVEIPKPDGKGMRKLGIPTVLDRLIQQAVHQVMQGVFDKGFSKSSYGFRPGRSAHQAVLQAREYVASGRRWVVDIDLEKFFDRVNHDVLMSRVAWEVKDKRILALIRRYLQAGVMEGGVTIQTVEGTPQGGPLSPLLSNILLDELDKEIEKRGHKFCRYADDCNVYVKSKRAGERIMSSLTRFLQQRLKLKINQEKSAVDRPWKRKFLGYGMTWHQKPRLKVAEASKARFAGKLRERFREGRGRSLTRIIEKLKPVLMGWVRYFSLSEVKGSFEELDGWIRRKLRCIQWKQWKRPYTRAKNLMRRGMEKNRALKSAMNGRGAWWNSGASHMNEAYPKKFFDKLGLVSLLQQLKLIQCTT